MTCGVRRAALTFGEMMDDRSLIRREAFDGRGEPELWVGESFVVWRQDFGGHQDFADVAREVFCGSRSSGPWRISARSAIKLATAGHDCSDPVT